LVANGTKNFHFPYLNATDCERNNVASATVPLLAPGGLQTSWTDHAGTVSDFRKKSVKVRKPWQELGRRVLL
jgi:hypothetical protein